MLYVKKKIVLSSSLTSFEKRGQEIRSKRISEARRLAPTSSREENLKRSEKRHREFTNSEEVQAYRKVRKPHIQRERKIRRDFCEKYGNPRLLIVQHKKLRPKKNDFL